MNLQFSTQDREFRQQAKTWLDDNVPDSPLPSGDSREGFALHLEWERKLYDAGWSAVSWPKEFGGKGATLMQWLIFEEEYYRAQAPQRVTQNGIFLLAPTIFEFGTDAQKERILRPMARGDVTWAQAWSEPGAGSDLANVRSTATKVDGGWRLSGQKTWSTRASFCDMGYGMFRSDPDSKRHKGLTYFMFPLDADGVTVRGFDRLDGDEGFAEIFLDDVFVADDSVIGEVDRGWYVAMATTSSERGLSLRSPGRFMATASRLVDLIRQSHRTCSLSGSSPANAAAIRDAVARAWIAVDAYRLYTFQSVTRMQAGGSLGADSSMNKVFWSEMDLQMHETALAVLGATAELDESATAAHEDATWLKGYQFALAGPIYAGTNEIQRNIIAERVLGLPRK